MVRTAAQDRRGSLPAYLRVTSPISGDGGGIASTSTPQRGVMQEACRSCKGGTVGGRLTTPVLPIERCLLLSLSTFEQSSTDKVIVRDGLEID